jgi:hypothetical protein
MKRLTIEEILLLIEKNPFNFGRMIRSRHREFYDFIDSNFKGTRFPEKLYRYINIDNKILGICPDCGEDCKFIHINKGFSYRCSTLCHNRAAQRSKEEKSMAKYGVKNISQAQEIKDKKKETCLSHFGIDCNLKLESTKEQIRNTNLKKYGTEHPNQSPEIIRRNLETLYERFFTDIRYDEVVPLFTKEEYQGVEIEHRWKCKLCNHEFNSHLQDGRIPRCYKCYPTNISLVELEFLDYMKVPEEYRQKYVSGFKLDGYEPINNTAIEFLGDYYHGNLLIYPRDKLNKTCDETFGKLYDDSFKKFDKLTLLGYKVKYIWELDWNNWIKSGKLGECPIKTYKLNCPI